LLLTHFVYAEPPVVKGSFEYQETSGVNRTAWTTNCAAKLTAGPFHLTSDAEWMVQVPGKANADGPFEWLTYQGTDGAVWLVKIHCEVSDASGDAIRVWFEHKKRDDGTGHHEDGNIVVIDWQGHKYEVAPQNIDTHTGKPAAGPIQFQLTRYPDDFH
jgi:hypothetical protein